MKKTTSLALTGLLVFMSGCSMLPFAARSSAADEVAAEAPSAATAAPAEKTLNDTALGSVADLDGAVLSVVQQTFQQIYTAVNPSVVNIQITESYGPSYISGEGSGFVWDMEGYIVTNNHVVENASMITVVFSDGTSADAKLVGNDPESDLAVIKVDPAAVVLHPVILGDSHAVQVGDLVIAIGNPYGLSGTMTQGIVSALSRSLSVNESNPFSTGTYTIPDIIQTDAAINPGNSGGVLVNVDGQVVGVTSAIQSSTDSNSGIGLVIPSHIVKRVIPVLIKNGSYDHPRLGISGVTMNPGIAESIGVTSSQEGVLIVDISRGGPADKAGLIGSSQQRTASGTMKITGGDIITAINGVPIKTYEDLVSYMFNNTEVGQKIALTILRNGNEKTVDLTL